MTDLALLLPKSNFCWGGILERDEKKKRDKTGEMYNLMVSVISEIFAFLVDPPVSLNTKPLV